MICCSHSEDLLLHSDDLFMTILMIVEDILMIYCGHSDDLLLTF